MVSMVRLRKLGIFNVGKRGLKVDLCVVSNCSNMGYRHDGGGILFSGGEQNGKR